MATTTESKGTTDKAAKKGSGGFQVERRARVRQARAGLRRRLVGLGHRAVRAGHPVPAQHDDRPRARRARRDPSDRDARGPSRRSSRRSGRSSTSCGSARFTAWTTPRTQKRYSPTTWAAAGRRRSPRASRAIASSPGGGSLPLAGATAVRVHRSRTPEMLLHLPRHGGILLTCDSVQNWETTTGCSFLGGAMARDDGLPRSRVHRPRLAQGERAEGRRRLPPGLRALLEHDFRHAIGGHGAPIRTPRATTCAPRSRGCTRSARDRRGRAARVSPLRWSIAASTRSRSASRESPTARSRPKTTS